MDFVRWILSYEKAAFRTRWTNSASSSSILPFPRLNLASPLSANEPGPSFSWSSRAFGRCPTCANWPPGHSSAFTFYVLRFTFYVSHLPPLRLHPHRDHDRDRHLL